MLRRYWYFSISLGYNLLCLRQVIASFYEGHNALPATVLLFTGCFLVGLVWPRSGLTAFIIAVPCLNGLAQSVLLTTPTPLSDVFSSLSLGITLRNFVDGFPIPKIEHNNEISIRVLFGTNVINSAILLSFGVQCWFLHDSPNFWTAMFTRATFAFGDPDYFITASLVWLQGLFIFKQATKLQIATVAQIRMIMWATLISTCIFMLFQYRFRIPTPYNHQTMGDNFAYYLPFDDISSFGSISVSLLVYFLISAIHERSRACVIIATIVTGGLVINSWSRAAWLAGTMILMSVVGLRLRKTHALILISLVCGSVVVLNQLSITASVDRSPYLSRLVSLIRFESLETKSAGRASLYRKALRMTIEHPLLGHGIGSYYLKSVRYADSIEESSASNIPEFSHNVYLQLATELGLPITATFGLIVFAALAAPAFPWDKNKKIWPVLLRCSSSPISMAVAVYILTQFTANSLNIYPSNQFYFWILVAAAINRPIPRNHAS